MKPYAKAMTIRYVGLQDRRRKLTDEQRAEIIRLHDEKGLGCRTIAKMFGVSLDELFGYAGGQDVS